MTGRQKGNDGPEKGRAPVSIATPDPVGAPPKTRGRCLVAALTRKGIPVASWIAVAQNRAAWRSATRAGLPQATAATNYIGRSALARAGSSLEGMVTGKTCSNEGPSWITALENGRSTCMESRAIMATLAWCCTVPTVPRWRNSGRHVSVKIIYFLPCYFLFMPTAFKCTRIKQTPYKNIKC